MHAYLNQRLFLSPEFRACFIRELRFERNFSDSDAKNKPSVLRPGSRLEQTCDTGN